MRHADASPDETRRLLRAFGVSVTNFEERASGLLERLRDPSLTVEERAAIAARIARLSADLDQRLREVTVRVLDLQSATLREVHALLSGDEADAR